jgi:RNA polymerase sigma-70 factor (ECF subfamily)
VPAGRRTVQPEQRQFPLEQSAYLRELLVVTVDRAGFQVAFLLVDEEALDAETEVVGRLRRGDVGALGEIYDAHHTHVRRFARRFLGEESAAEDLVQDTFLALPRAIGRFRGDSSLRTFLVSIAVNHARHHLRSAIRRRSAHDRLGAEPPASPAEPEEEARRRELAAALVRALDLLPLEQRTAVVLCDIEERTSAEAAQIVGVPEGTIRTRVFHARRKLRDALTGEGLR